MRGVLIVINRLKAREIAIIVENLFKKRSAISSWASKFVMLLDLFGLVRTINGQRKYSTFKTKLLLLSVYFN